MTSIHATCISWTGPNGPATRRGAAPLAILLRGPSGAGKSDLALRLIDRGWQLVSDDQTALTAESDRLVARAPETISGRMEVRGLGVLEVDAVESAEVALVVDLVPPDQIERLPGPESCELEGIAVPRLAFNAFETSAATKLELALRSRLEAPRAAPEPDPAKARRVVLVTGLSGAGRTTALDALEDLGYEAIDNPPLDLVAEIVRKPGAQPIAIGADIRTRAFAAEPFLALLEHLEETPELAVFLLFIDCEDDVLGRRYSETRRRHPLAHERPLRDGIAAERRLLAPLKSRADLVIDTTTLAPGDCQRIVAGHLGSDDSEAMTVFVTSFAFRRGLPRAADLVFDVRFLANPHYDRTLRPLTGLDPKIAAFVAADPDFEGFFGRLTDMLDPLLPRYEREGKSYLTIAVGCTGGRHRSVMVAERLAAWLRAQGRDVTLLHRDVDTT
ncbi:MAG: RNase adapter RapZ [Pseudomonadota bacterium]